MLLNRRNTSYTLEWALAQPITIWQNDYWVGSTHFYVEGGCIEPLPYYKKHYQLYNGYLAVLVKNVASESSSAHCSQ
jgi:hypothetical protein